MKQSNYAKIFKALANEQRFNIFMKIYEESKKGPQKKASFPAEEQSCCVVEKAFTKVCGCIKLSRSTVSHHFKELQNAGLITCERDGQMFRCRVNEEAVDSLKDIFK